MEKKKLLFVINQFFKGGAETALLNLFRALPAEEYEIDFLVFDQIDLLGTISLFPSVPDWIHTVNAAQGEAEGAFVKKAWFRLCRQLTLRQLFRRSATAYLCGRRYDAAISYGEWFSSRLVAEYARARRKYVWIHADMDKAGFVHPDIIRYERYFDGFLFASRCSMECAEERYPFLRGRGTVVHNLVCEEELRTLAGEAPGYSLPGGLPVLLTVANIRDEKNHLRQVRVMERLFREGKRFFWLNVGSLANFELTAQVKAAVRKSGLEEYFLLPGAMENPYPLIKRADAVCVLSDHESWSMVITEAKALGTPVIATRTSGSLEQLEDGKTGILCGFSDEEISEAIRGYLDAPEIGRRLRERLRGFSARGDTLEQLEPLLGEDRKKILYLFDNVNYLSGARNAALEQMRCLSARARVELFSLEPCADAGLRALYRTVDLGETDRGEGLRCLSLPCRDVIRGKRYSWKWKCTRVAYALLARLGQERVLPDALLNKTLPPLLNGYDAVCVVSESSKLRGTVAKLEGPRKIQWIHTDYAAWREQTAWTRAVTKKDREFYRGFDRIVCLSERLREGFVRIYPELEAKTVVVSNFIAYDRTRELSMAACEITVEKGLVNFVTVGRMEREKRYDLALQAASALKARGTRFHWYFVGDGPLLEETRAMSRHLGLMDKITFTGNLDNPYPLMRQCDALVLLSDYEGTPVTVDEAKVLRLPVLARDVGGIPEQLEDGTYGRILREPEDLTLPVPSTGAFSRELALAHRRSVEARLIDCFFGNP